MWLGQLRKWFSTFVRLGSMIGYNNEITNFIYITKIECNWLFEFRYLYLSLLKIISKKNIITATKSSTRFTRNCTFLNVYPEPVIPWNLFSKIPCWSQVTPKQTFIFKSDWLHQDLDTRMKLWTPFFLWYAEDLYYLLRLYIIDFNILNTLISEPSVDLSRM